MTRERLQELWPVMEAFKNGKIVESRMIGKPSSFWCRQENPMWSDDMEYRIKLEPREFYINVYSDRYHVATCKKLADMMADDSRLECIRVREVIE